MRSETLTDASIRKIARGKMVLCALLTLIYELLHLTPLRRLYQNLTTKGDL